VVKVIELTLPKNLGKIEIFGFAGNYKTLVSLYYMTHQRMFKPTLWVNKEPDQKIKQISFIVFA
jgi:hypothetical protein